MGTCCGKSNTIKKYFAEELQRKKKPFTASARKIGSDKFVITQIMALSAADAKDWFDNHGYEIEGNIY